MHADYSGLRQSYLHTCLVDECHVGMLEFRGEHFQPQRCRQGNSSMRTYATWLQPESSASYITLESGGFAAAAASDWLAIGGTECKGFPMHVETSCMSVLLTL
jgi:hypothetical protein